MATVEYVRHNDVSLAPAAKILYHVIGDGHRLGMVGRRRHRYDANQDKGTPRAKMRTHTCWFIVGDYGSCFETRDAAASWLLRAQEAPHGS